GVWTTVQALPTFRALHHRFGSEGGIAVAAPEHIATLLAAMGLFRKVIPLNGTTRNRIQVLKSGHFRRAVILPNSFRAAMITYAAGIKERWGYNTDARGLLLTHGIRRNERRHQLDDYSALLAAINAPRVVDEIPSLKLPVHIREKARKKMR